MDSESNSSPRLRIAICGGGISGLALAAFLAPVPDIEVCVFEAKSSIRTIGAGIAVWRRYWDILDSSLDFSSACEAHGISRPNWSAITGPVLRKSDIASGGHDFYSLSHGPMVIARTTILDIFHRKSHRTRCTVHTGKSLLSYEVQPDKSVRLRFADGTESNTDLLLGADGVHSRVRAQMYAVRPADAQPRFSGQFAYRMKVLRADLERSWPGHLALQGFKIWCGRGMHVTSNAVGEWIQMTAYDNVPVGEGADGPLQGDWSKDVDAKHVASSYQGWEPELRRLLGMVDQASSWAIHVVRSLPSYVERRVALLGDAAHAMAPHMGLGGGQGVEDAYILAALLADARVGKKNVDGALALYDGIRRPKAQAVADASLSNGLLYGFLNPRFEGATLEEIGQELNASTDWLIQDGGCERERKRAKGKLAEHMEATQA